jgi:hypothetical protein
MVGWRSIDAASSLDLATSENRHATADMKRRHTLRNYAGNRRVIDAAFDLATRQPVPAEIFVRAASGLIRFRRCSVSQPI